MDIDEERLRQILCDELNKRSRIDTKTHNMHHAAYAEDLERRRRRREFWEGVRKSVIIAAILGGLAWVIKVFHDGIVVELGKALNK